MKEHLQQPLPRFFARSHELWPPYICSSSLQLPLANRIYLFGAFVPCFMNVRKLVFQYISYGAVGRHVGLGLYDIHGNRVLTTGALDTSGWTSYDAEAVDVDGFPVLVSPGYYFWAITGDNSWVTLRGATTPETNMNRFRCYTTTQSSGGVLPATISVADADLTAIHDVFPWMEIRESPT